MWLPASSLLHRAVWQSLNFKGDPGTLIFQVLGNYNSIFWETGNAAAWGVIHCKKARDKSFIYFLCQ